jgi:hypothetical protein
MQPVKQTTTMATLDFASTFANGRWALPPDLQTVLLFFQKDVDQQSQSPEAHQSLGAHELVMVQSKLFFAVGEEDFNVPARREMGKQGVRIRIQIAGGPIPRLRERSRERMAHDHHLATVQLAYPGGYHMDVDRFAAARPGRLHKILLPQACARYSLSLYQRHPSGNWLEQANERLHQGNLALKRDFFAFAHLLLPI